MGGAAAEPTSKGGKKPLDANINLVPYIDMLMTIMTFLMMTAVWTQIAMLEVQNASGGGEPEPEAVADKPKAILVAVTAGAIQVQEEQAPETNSFAAAGGGYDFTGLDVELRRLKQQRPERAEVKITSEDGIPFSTLARVVDLARGAALPAISLTPIGS